MSLTNNIEEKIDAYLKGKLSEKEVEAFEVEMANDPALANQCQQEKLFYDAVFQHKLMDIKSIAQENELALKNQSKPSSIKKKLFIGGGVLLLGLGALYLISAENVESNASGEKPVISNVAEEEQPVVSSSENKSDHEALKTTVEKGSVEAKIGYKSDSSVNTSTVVAETQSQNSKAPINTDKMDSTGVNEPESSFESPCEQTGFPDLEITGSCPGKSEGAVNIKAVFGGRAPYQKELYSSDGNTVSTEGLLPGNYSLVITDANNCIKVVGVDIPKKACPIDDAFNPSLGEKWKAPLASKEGTLTIHTKSGTPLLTKSLKAEEQYMWDGQTQNGVLAPGYYIFVITYKDGTSLKGSITITE